MAGCEGGETEVLGDGGLAEAAAALEQDVLAAAEEVEREEPLNECTVELLGMAPVEAVEGLDRSARLVLESGPLQRSARIMGSGSTSSLASYMWPCSRAMASRTDGIAMPSTSAR